MEQTDSTAQTTQPPKQKTFGLLLMIAALCILVLIALIVMGMRSRSNQSTQSEQIQNLLSPTPTPQVKKGTALLTTVNNVLRYKKGTTVTIYVKVNSQESTVEGYDLLLQYQHGAFNFVRATTELPTFRPVVINKPGFVAITAAKAQGSQTGTVFSGSTLESFVFTATKTGSFHFSLISVDKNGKTMFVDQNLKELYPLTNSLTLEIY